VVDSAPGTPEPTAAWLYLPGSIAEELGRVRRWLVTGAAGFIGSHLVEALLLHGQDVVGVDDFSTGTRSNLEDVAARSGPERWRRFVLLEGDIRSAAVCRRAVESVDVVLHQAALGSVPRSLEHPLETHAVNVLGTVQLLEAVRRGPMARFVFASSSSVYGDDPSLPKVEATLGSPLSPYAASKVAAELAARVYARAFGLVTVGLRYFNVYGPRQRPDGPYAAVVPRWIEAFLDGRPVVVYGDGESSRDFCFVADAVRANLLAALGDGAAIAGSVVNVAGGERSSLNRLFGLLRERISRALPEVGGRVAVHEPFRPGDVRHSEADLAEARRALGFQPRHDLRGGLDETVAWYQSRREGAPAARLTAGKAPR
jgi:UDP-N-acetylglucosamine 4-epimerase